MKKIIKFTRYVKYHLSQVFSIKNIIMDWNTRNVFQILPFYNTFIERLKIRKLSNLELLQELPFMMN